jgi:hypothetical protein
MILISLVGTFEKCRPALTMSASRGGIPEVSGERRRDSGYSGPEQQRAPGVSTAEALPRVGSDGG